MQGSFLLQQPHESLQVFLGHEASARSKPSFWSERATACLMYALALVNCRAATVSTASDILVGTLNVTDASYFGFFALMICSFRLSNSKNPATVSRARWVNRIRSLLLRR
jgi:hypothetical protein